MEVWADTDMGVDDLFALLLLAQEARVVGVSLSFGVSSLAQARRNASGACAAFGWNFPLYAGAGRSVLGGVETAERILGPTGIRSRGRTLPDVPDIVHEGALEAMAAWLAGQTHAQILALGPLTNLAILALARPHLLSHIGRITWMGGGITRGNHTPSAEFNAFADPEALAILLARGAPVRMIDLDACRQVQITEEDAMTLDARARSAAGGRTAILADLFGGYLDIARERGRPSMALYDPVAAAALVRPDLFAFAPAGIRIDATGARERGRTSVEPCPGANGEVVMSVDVAEVKRLCLAPLAATT